LAFTARSAPTVGMIPGQQMGSLASGRFAWNHGRRGKRRCEDDRMHALRRQVLLLPILLASAGCNSPQPLHWSEQVRLADGTIVVLERWAQKNHVTFLGRTMTGGVSDEVLALPGHGSMRWEQNHSGIPGKYTDGSGQQPVTPFALDRVDGRWILATSRSIHDCASASDEYLVYFLAWDGKSWIRVPQTDHLLDGTTANLLRLGATLDRLPFGSVSLEEKAALTGEDFPATPRSIRQFLGDGGQATCAEAFAELGVVGATPASPDQAGQDRAAAGTSPE
jgi:hypothetical protein